MSGPGPFYGIFEVKPQDFDDMAVTAIDLDAAAGATAKILTITYPCAPLYFGYRPATDFDYHTFTTQGVLSLYKYPAGDASAKVLLGSIDLDDGAVTGEIYAVKIANTPTAGATAGHAKTPKADCGPKDKLAFWIGTQAVGDTYILGTFQPFLMCQYRGESFAEMSTWHDETPAGSGIVVDV